jgi:hypothetical protein
VEIFIGVLVAFVLLIGFMSLAFKKEGPGRRHASGGDSGGATSFYNDNDRTRDSDSSWGDGGSSDSGGGDGGGGGGD